MTQYQIFSAHSKKDLLVKYLVFVSSPLIMTLLSILFGSISLPLMTVTENIGGILMWCFGFLFLRASWLASGEWLQKKISSSFIRIVLRIVILLATLILALLSAFFFSFFLVFLFV